MKYQRPEIRPPYARPRSKTIIEGESMTQHSHADQTNVNLIVERFQRTGYMPPPTRQPQYGDVTGLQVDLTEAYNRSLDTIQSAQEYAAQWEIQRAKEAEELSRTPPAETDTPPVAPTD